MKQFNVTGMSCAACSSRVEKAVSKVPGVTSCSVSLLTNSMGVDGTASAQAIIQAVEQAGYGFIDVTTHLRNDTGGLNPDCGGGDGIHVNKLGYYSMLTDVAKRLVADRH